MDNQRIIIDRFKEMCQRFLEEVGEPLTLFAVKGTDNSKKLAKNRYMMWRMDFDKFMEQTLKETKKSKTVKQLMNEGNSTDTANS